jgi:cytoskeletal protein CcmA (bactofilin family)
MKIHRLFRQSRQTASSDQRINGGKNMGFFKDFKDDLSQAVNELVPGEDDLEMTTNEDDLVVNTLEGEVDVESELSKLDGLLEQVARQETAEAAAAEEETVKQEEKLDEISDDLLDIFPEQPAESDTIKTAQEEKKMSDTTLTQQKPQQKPQVSDEVSIITEGTVIRGDIVSSGALDIRGQVDGNVGCNGKLVVTGMVNGNSNASEFFADAAKIEGEVVSTGTVKIGLGSVVIGNVTSSSAVIAGAIKGDIDVQGPVVVDTSAVVMGNIKSRSVQINNGAVIEGFCSQCYSDVDVQSLFDIKKETI